MLVLDLTWCCMLPRACPLTCQVTLVRHAVVDMMVLWWQVKVWLG